LLDLDFARDGDVAPLCLLPIHPSNFRLFPNLANLWPNFQQFAFRKFSITAQPLASSLASGAYCISTLANSNDAALHEGYGIVPVFSALLNVATTVVTTIWRPLVYNVAGNILRRMGSYLISSSEAGLSSPGSIAVDNLTSSQTGNPNGPLPASDAMPILTANYDVHFKDFIPGARS